jgi:hypothetical protein
MKKLVDRHTGGSIPYINKLVDRYTRGSIPYINTNLPTNQPGKSTETALPHVTAHIQVAMENS